jgi:hypothetical protein
VHKLCLRRENQEKNSSAGSPVHLQIDQRGF